MVCCGLALVACVPGLSAVIEGGRGAGDFRLMDAVGYSGAVEVPGGGGAAAAVRREGSSGGVEVQADTRGCPGGIMYVLTSQVIQCCICPDIVQYKI